MLLTSCLLLSGMLCCCDYTAHTVPFCDQYNTIYLPYSHFVGISVTWLIAVGGRSGGGVQNPPCVLRTSIYEGVRVERGEDWFQPVLHIYTPLSLTLPVFYFIDSPSTH